MKAIIFQRCRKKRYLRLCLFLFLGSTGAACETEEKTGVVMLAAENLVDPTIIGAVGDEIFLLDQSISPSTNSRLLAFHLVNRGFRVVGEEGVGRPLQIGMDDERLVWIDANGWSYLSVAGGRPERWVTENHEVGALPNKLGKLDVHHDVTVHCDEAQDTLFRIDLRANPAVANVLAKGCVGAALLEGEHVFFGRPSEDGHRVFLVMSSSHAHQPDSEQTIFEGQSPQDGVKHFVRGGRFIWALIGDELVAFDPASPAQSVHSVARRPDVAPFFSAGDGVAYILGETEARVAIEEIRADDASITRIESQDLGTSTYHLTRGYYPISIWARYDNVRERNVLYYSARRGEEGTSAVLVELVWPDFSE